MVVRISAISRPYPGYIPGSEYVVVRISGLAFVLHQIRHMIGAAIAVARGLVPPDVFAIALDSPFQVDACKL